MSLETKRGALQGYLTATECRNAADKAFNEFYESTAKIRLEQKLIKETKKFKGVNFEDLSREQLIEALKCTISNNMVDFD